jgi:hypothetical protein
MAEKLESRSSPDKSPALLTKTATSGPQQQKKSSRRNQKGEVFTSKKSSSVKARQEAAVKGSSALGQKARKVMKKRLESAGVKPERLPAIFRDKEVARSRKGAAGQLIVKDMSGLVRNNAARLASKFEKELTEGKEDIIEKLEMVPPERQTQLQRRLIDTMRANPRWSFGRCVAEAKANLATTMNQYAEGLLALNKLESMMELYRQMPDLMRDIMHHAVDQMEVCNVCFGEGMVTPRAGGKTLSKKCPRCEGSGKQRVSSPHKAIALKEAVEIAKLKPERGPMVAIQQNTQINSGGGDVNLLEKMAKATDEVLYGDRDRQEEIEAEIVYPDDIPLEG